MSKRNSGAKSSIIWGSLLILFLSMTVIQCVSPDRSDGNPDNEKQEWIDSEMKKADDFCARNPDFESCW